MDSPRPRDNLLDAAWQPRTVIWVFILVVGLALVLALAPHDYGRSLQSRAIQFGLTALVGAWIATITLGMIYLARARLSALPHAVIGWIALAVLLLVTALASAATWSLSGAHPPQSMSGFLARHVGIAAVIGILGLGVFQTLWVNTRLRRRAEASEIAALRAMTRPHFLFNTLNTAIALVRQQPGVVETLLLDLADLFRAALRQEQECSLEQDVELAKKYLDIERLRFGERLLIDWIVPDALPQVAMPTLALQTLAENAVHHGIEGRTEPGRIAIHITCDEESIQIIVLNDLPDPSAPARSGHGLGLHALEGRIRSFGNGSGRLEMHKSPDSFRATLRLPVRTFLQTLDPTVPLR